MEESALAVIKEKGGKGEQAGKNCKISTDLGEKGVFLPPLRNPSGGQHQSFMTTYVSGALWSLKGDTEEQ